MTTSNFLSPLNFMFTLSRTPDLVYSVQTISIPGVNLTTSSIPTPFVPIVNPSNISFGELAVSFKVNEDLSNWLELFNWMVSLAPIEDLEDYADAETDCTVTILNSAKTPIISIEFKDILPTSLSSLDFDASIQDVQHLTASASFTFSTMKFVAL